MLFQGTVLVIRFMPISTAFPPRFLMTDETLEKVFLDFTIDVNSTLVCAAVPLFASHVKLSLFALAGS